MRGGGESHAIKAGRGCGEGVESQVTDLAGGHVTSSAARVRVGRPGCAGIVGFESLEYAKTRHPQSCLELGMQKLPRLPCADSYVALSLLWFLPDRVCNFFSRCGYTDD